MRTELMSKPGRKSHRRILNGIALAALAGIGIAAMTFNSTEPVEAKPPIPNGYDLKSWQDNGANGKYLLEYSEGQMPVAGTELSGVVLSDSNCMADEQGLSHCINEIRFADGSTLTVIDNHNMGINRCLQPGETVSITTFNDAWVVGLTEEAKASS